MQNSAARRFSSDDLLTIQLASRHVDSRGRARAETSLGVVELRVEQHLGQENRLIRIGLPVDAGGGTPASSPGQPIPLAGSSPSWRTLVDTVRRAQAGIRPLLLVGEAGVGKASLAAGEALNESRVGTALGVIDAQALVTLGPARWFEQAGALVRSGKRVIVTRIDALESRQLGGLRSLVRAADFPHRIALTIAAGQSEAAAFIGFMLDAHAVKVPALRTRGADLAELWASFALRVGAAPGATLSTSALTALRHHTWPGNLPELRAAAIHAVSQKHQACVQRADLPSYLPGRPQQGLMERAEQDAIRRALLVAEGNRSRAAELLGISRATLYRKIRASAQIEG